MTLQDEIARLGARIAAARAERDRAQAAGVLHRYLDAIYRLQALERDLDWLAGFSGPGFTRADPGPLLD